MYVRRIFSTVAIAVAMAALLTEVKAQSVESTELKLEGTWEATLTSGSFREKERYTFTTGRTPDEGSLIFSNEVDAVPPCGTDQGVWVRTGPRTFNLTHGAFCADFSSETFYTMKFRETLTVGPRGNGFNGRGLLEIFDPGGTLLFSAEYTVRGTRMLVESLPLSKSSSAPSIPGGWFQGKRPVSNGSGAQF